LCHDSVPDECELTSETDVDSDSILDVCEPDCNSNGTPDDYDIANEISTDCNADGVPDECQLGYNDCNHNGVPDDCDIADETSADCNGNSYPDECELTLPPGFGALDCNENGIPDLCDIASSYSADANNNHIPDECESEGYENSSAQQGDGESESPCTGFSEEECWAVFWDWATQQCWGPDCELSGYEQYQALVSKLNELGLPLEALLP
jgi:hypothetical protein